jgi:hypothetical protein
MMNRPRNRIHLTTKITVEAAGAVVAVMAPNLLESSLSFTRKMDSPIFLPGAVVVALVVVAVAGTTLATEMMSYVPQHHIIS